MGPFDTGRRWPLGSVSASPVIAATTTEQQDQYNDQKNHLGIAHGFLLVGWFNLKLAL